MFSPDACSRRFHPTDIGHDASRGRVAFRDLPEGQNVPFESTARAVIGPLSVAVLDVLSR